MNVEIGAEAAQFLEKECINGIFVAVWVKWELWIIFKDKKRIRESGRWQTLEIETGRSDQSFFANFLFFTFIRSRILKTKVGKAHVTVSFLYDVPKQNKRWKTAWFRKWHMDTFARNLLVGGIKPPPPPHPASNKSNLVSLFAWGCNTVKRLSFFPSPAGMSLTKLSLDGNTLQ